MLLLNYGPRGQVRQDPDAYIFMYYVTGGPSDLRKNE